MNKRKISIILNIIIIIMEIVGLFYVFTTYKKAPIEYYTEDSNILSLIVSTIFLVFLLRKKEIPKYLKHLKYTNTICLTVTLLVVIFILAPMYNFDYGYLLFHNELLYHHLLCPVLSIITFIFFDDLGKLTIKDSIKGLSFTFIYAFILIILNLFKVVEGPYSFLKVYKQPIYMSIIWFVVIIGLAYFISFMVRKIHNKVN